MRLALWFALLAAACTSDDDRPLTVDYVTDAVLRPTCAGAACHSSFAQNRGFVFDSIDGVRRSVYDLGLVTFDSTKYDPATPGNADLIKWVTETDPLGLGIGRMPYDQPMPNEDILYLEKWIAAGAPGAQCDPVQAAATNGACNNKALYACNDDWTFGALVMSCPTMCASGICQ